MITDYLVLIILAISVFHTIKYNVSYSLPSIIFGGINFCYSLTLSDHKTALHYFLGAFLALCIAGLISLYKCSRLAIELQFICVLDITFNMVGWVLYELYQEPYYYDGLFVALYMWTICVMIKYEGIKYGDNSMGWRGGIFFNNLNKGCAYLLRGKR